MEWRGVVGAGSGTRLPQIIEPNEESQQKSPKSRLVNVLDEVEMHVERLRRDALKLEEEKDRLLATLDSLRNSEIMIDLGDSEREDVLHSVEHIANRCLTVDILVKTTRDNTQEDALHQVNSFIDGLVMSLRSDPDGTKTRCLAFMNACSSHTHE